VSDDELLRRAELYPDLILQVVEDKHLIERLRSIVSMLIPSGLANNPRRHTLHEIDDHLTVTESLIDRCARPRKPAGGDTRGSG
jgi:hypothetical protein